MPPFIPLEKILRAQALKASGLSWSKVGRIVGSQQKSIQGAVRRYERGLHNGLREKQFGVPAAARLDAEAQARATAIPLEEHLALVAERKRQVRQLEVRRAYEAKRRTFPPKVLTPEQRERKNTLRRKAREKRRQAELARKPIVMLYKAA